MIDYKIKVGRPPNFFKIVQAFPKAANATTIFAYGDSIYVSDPTVQLPMSLYKHECVHLRRQKEIGVDVWWDKYINDDEFRYQEELIAHRTEFHAIVGNETNKTLRNARLKNVAKRLIAPLYRFNVSLERAMVDIGMVDIGM